MEKVFADEHINVLIIYHERIIPKEEVEYIVKHFSNDSPLQKARRLMRFVDNANACKGNLLEEEGLVLYKLAGHSQTPLVTGANGISQKGAFSVECKVLTIFNGSLCV